MKGRIAHFGEGIWGPDFEQPYAVVGMFLWQDVGCSIECCDYYLDAGLDVAAGNTTTIEVRGNCTVAQIMPTWVLIRYMFDNDEGLEPAVISMDAYLSAVRYWKSIVASWDRRSPPTDPPEFSYEDPEPVPPLSPDEVARQINSLREGLVGHRHIHHVSELDEEGPLFEDDSSEN